MTEPPIQKTVSEKAIRSVKWTALTELVSRTAAPLVAVILARLLTPEDFGVVATAMIAISFAQMFWEAGLGKALVQTEETKESAANVVFWTNLVLGLVIFAGLFVLAPWLAVFFESPASSSVLRVLGLQIVIGSLSSVQHALFVRDLDFRRLFWINLLTAAVPGAFSIPMALSGYGVWALVAGSLVGQVLNLALSWHFSSWRPNLSYDIQVARGMFRFGSWIVIGSLATWLISWGDSLIVGKFLGVEDLGVYRTSWIMASMAFAAFLNPFISILYPSLSRLQNDLQKLTEYFSKANRIVISLCLPIGVGLFVLGPEIASTVFGNQWQGLGTALRVMGLLFGLSWTVGINGELYRAIGRPDVTTKLVLLSVCYYYPAYFIAAPFGLETFLWVRLAVALVAIPLHIYLCRRMLGLPWLYLWHHGRSFIAASVAMGLAVGGVRFVMRSAEFGIHPVVELAALVAFGVGVYAVTVWFIERKFVADLMQLAQRATVAP